MQSDGAYVYLIFDRDAVPRYVGKGRGMRWQAHRSASHNKELARLVRESDAELPVVIIRQNLTDEEAFNLEMALIRAIGRGNRGPLLNLSDGGEGVVNPSAETRALISEKAKQRLESLSARKALSESVKKGMASSRVRERISVKMKGRKVTWASKIGAKAAERMSDPERRAHLSRVMKEIPQTAETRAKRSTSMLAYWQKRREAGLSMNRPARNEQKRREAIREGVILSWQKRKAEAPLSD